MSRRILTFTHGHPDLSYGGSERAAYTLYQAYQASPDVEAAWFLAVAPERTGSGHLRQWRPGEYLVDFAPADDLRMRVMRDAHDVKALFDLIRSLGVTTLHLHHYYSIGTDTLHALRRAFPNLQILLTLHEYLAICMHDGQMVKVGSLELCSEPSPPACAQCFPALGEATMWLRRDYLREALLQADGFVSPSHHLADTYIRWGIPSERIRVIENAQAPLAPLPPRARPRGDNTVRFGYFGQVTPYKGLDVLLQALNLVPVGIRSQMSLVINGANLELQRPEVQARLKKMSAPLERTGVVRWAGSYRHDALQARLVSVDWVVVPSVWWENSPMVIQESLASGRPVMCSNIGGMAEKVLHDVNGWHVEVGDAQAWADAFISAVDGSIEWERLQRRCGPGPASAEVSAAYLDFMSLLEARRA